LWLHATKAAEFIVGDKPRWETNVDLCLKKQHRVGNNIELGVNFEISHLCYCWLWVVRLWFRRFLLATAGSIIFFERDCGGDPHNKEI
jgi:hypothetical protein